MGREPKPLKNHAGRFLIDYPIDEPEKYTYMEKIRAIMKRETLSFNQVATKALCEYVDRHYYGNSQTLLESYEEGGIKSDGQIEQMIVNYFLERHRKRYDVYYRDILKEVRQTLELQGEELINTGQRIIEQLLDEEVKIIQ